MLEEELAKVKVGLPCELEALGAVVAVGYHGFSGDLLAIGGHVGQLLLRGMRGKASLRVVDKALGCHDEVALRGGPQGRYAAVLGLVVVPG